MAQQVTEKDQSTGWSFDKLRDSMGPASQRNMDRRMKVFRLQQRIYRACPWMSGPLLGLVTVFWTSLIEEGPRSTFHQWGPIGFSYLNDGIKPTLWHTWQQVMHPRGKYSGIWVTRGAPRSKAEADKWEAEAAARR